MNNDLKIMDYKILNYLNNNPNSDFAKISETLNEIHGMEERLSLLHRLEVVRYTGTYEVTEIGKQILQDYEIQVIKDRKSFWMKSILTPIGVAIVTSIITLYITHLITKFL